MCKPMWLCSVLSCNSSALVIYWAKTSLIVRNQTNNAKTNIFGDVKKWYACQTEDIITRCVMLLVSNWFVILLLHFGRSHLGCSYQFSYCMQEAIKSFCDNLTYSYLFVLPQLCVAVHMSIYSMCANWQKFKLHHTGQTTLLICSFDNSCA